MPFEESRPYFLSKHTSRYAWNQLPLDKFIVVLTGFFPLGISEILSKRQLIPKHILMYAYSENMAETLQKAFKKNRQKRTLAIVSPPLGESNHLLTYTDAVVVNKHQFRLWQGPNFSQISTLRSAST